jgi:citrate synthase
MTVVSKGLEGITVAQTRIGDVRGDIGQLIYCGYDINELAGKVCFEEVVYLLWEGRLPKRDELEQLRRELIAARPLPKALVDMLKLLPKNAPPMHVLRTAVSMLGALDTEADLNTPEVNRRKALQLVAQFPSIVAKFHRIRQGLPIVQPSAELNSTAANFLYMLNGEAPSEEAVAAIDMAFVLHAEHAFNASTFAARVTIATLSDMYSAITSAIGTLKGPLHGGANEGVIKMLLEIGDESRVDAYVRAKLANKERIMGIGHRVYKTLDPRAPHLKRLAEQLSAKVEPKWLRMSDHIASIMKQEKNLNANVDFYSATVYYSLGIPTDLFTPIFAIARTSGWTGHIIEQLKDNKIFRPSSEYVGFPVGKKVVPLDQR